MMLLDLIRKPISREAATAIPATRRVQRAATVARIATVAVASPTEMNTHASAGAFGDPQPSRPVATIASDPSDLISDYIERIAICVEAGDVAEEDAHRIASEQCGATQYELAARQVTYWCQRIQALPEPSDHRLIKIAPACRSVLTEPWLIDAIRLSWTDADLFGLDSGAPNAYFGNGLVTGIGLTKLRRPVRVVAINSDFVTVETGTGSILKHYRKACPGRPIWQHPAFTRLWH
jgi:hypothetical protein